MYVNTLCINFLLKSDSTVAKVGEKMLYLTRRWHEMGNGLSDETLTLTRKSISYDITILIL